MELRVELEIPESRFALLFKRLVVSRGQLGRLEGASLMGMRNRDFSRSFIENHEISFREFRQEIKTAIACGLLQHSGLRVSEIADFLSYSGLKEFRRAFVCRVGCSPLQFRRVTTDPVTKRQAGRCLITITAIDDRSARLAGATSGL